MARHIPATMLPRCINIPEIQLSLCEELVRDKSGRKSLIDLSLTNKMFQETALNELWKTQSSLIPLLKCFPSDSWLPQVNTVATSDSDDEGELESLEFTRCISRRDWDRVIFYARRIHSLDICKEEFNTLSTDVWQILSASLPTTMNCLLPELRELRYPDTDTAFHAFRLIISPQLNKLTLSLNGSAPLRITTFQSLPERSPGLTTLDIRDFKPSCAQGIGPTLLKLRALRNLTIGPVSRQIMDWIIAYLSVIETLDLRFCLPKGIDFGKEPLRPGILPRLRKATFRKIDMSIIPQVITPIGSNVLTEIRIHAMPGGNEERWTQVFAALLQFSNLLEYLEIKECPSPPSRSHMFLPQTTFEDILTFSKLKTLRIQTEFEMSLSNDFLGRLGESCKGLRVLEMMGSYPTTPYTAPTLRGLLPFLERCQELNQLSLYIDASKDPYDENPSPKYTAINQTLTSLHVGYSPICNTVDTGAFLATVTPNLESIQWTRKAWDPSRGNMWQQTELHLQLVKKLRSA